MAFLYRRDGSLRGLKTQRGFSLLELFVAIAILAIVVGFAMPMFRDVIRNTTVSNETNDLVTALSMARSEAVRRGTRVAVVANNGDWNTGWSVIADSNRSNTFTGADEVISAAPALNTGYLVSAKNGGPGGDDGEIVFTMNGALLTSGFDMNVCFPTGDATKSRRIRVRGSGSVSSHKNTTGSPASACPST
jgi:type IV fimbrial biogenesis protein FimT